MIHFDFIVSDADAEIIFDGIQELIVNSLQTQMKATTKQDKEMVASCEQNIKYLEELQTKMQHTRVKD